MIKNKMNFKMNSPNQSYFGTVKSRVVLANSLNLIKESGTQDWQVNLDANNDLVFSFESVEKVKFLHDGGISYFPSAGGPPVTLN